MEVTGAQFDAGGFIVRGAILVEGYGQDNFLAGDHRVDSCEFDNYPMPHTPVAIRDGDTVVTNKRIVNSDNGLFRTDFSTCTVTVTGNDIRDFLHGGMWVINAN